MAIPFYPSIERTSNPVKVVSLLGVDDENYEPVYFKDEKDAPYDESEPRVELKLIQKKHHETEFLTDFIG